MSITTKETARGERREEVSELIAKQFSARARDLLPLYRRLHEAIEDLIRSGSLQPGTQMPPEQVLATVLGISLGTVQKGLLSLSNKRLIVREHGRGTFVASARHSLTELRLFRFLDMDSESLLPVYATILGRTVVGPNPELLSIFGLDPKGYVHLSRLVDVDNRFTCYSELFLPASLFDKVLEMQESDLNDINLKRLFAERLNIDPDIYSQKIRLVQPSDEVRNILKLASNSIGMEMEIIERAEGNIVTTQQKIFIPPSKYALDIRTLHHG